MNQKMMKTLGIIIAGFVIFILILFVIASCSKTKYTYEKLEDKMLSVAKKYYEDNEDKLPKEDKGTSTYTLKNMISDEKIKELTELFDDEDINCDGSVTVTNNNGYYLYTPYLSCGSDYETETLVDKIIENSLVESGSGLYEVGEEYIFKGDVEDNYVSFGGRTYRIIRINDDGSIRLIDNSGIEGVAWDKKYNTEVSGSNGINEYMYAENLYANIKSEEDDIYNDSSIFTDEDKAYITTQTLCIGKRSKSDVTLDGSTECSLKLENQLIGSLAVYEYLQASLDSECTDTMSSSCNNYNWYTSIKGSFWTITANSEKTDYAFYISKKVASSMCNTEHKLNIVFNINSDVVYVSGNGTSDDPYVFE